MEREGGGEEREMGMEREEREDPEGLGEDPGEESVEAWEGKGREGRRGRDARRGRRARRKR